MFERVICFVQKLVKHFAILDQENFMYGFSLLVFVVLAPLTATGPSELCVLLFPERVELPGQSGIVGLGSKDLLF